MSKYLIKESELRAIISDAVMEELNEGLWHAFGSALKNTAKNAVVGAVAPGALAQKAFVKTGKIINGPDTLAGTVKDFFGGNTDGSQTGKSKNGANNRNTNSNQTGKLKNGANNRNTSAREYGRPETIGALGRTRMRKRPIVVNNFLGSGENIDFGRHYYEENQDRPSSRWSKMLQSADVDVNQTASSPGGRARKIRNYRRMFNRWLNERDKAYEEMMKARKR